MIDTGHTRWCDGFRWWGAARMILDPFLATGRKFSLDELRAARQQSQ
jgi:hypothetical protein